MARPPMKNSAEPKNKPREKRRIYKMHGRLKMPLASLAMLMMLVGCASPMLATSRGTPTPSGSAPKATQPTNPACLSMVHITPNRGKPGGATTEDIASALDRDQPVKRVRNIVGDNESTLIQIDKNNAALDSLCGGDGER